MVKKSVGWEGWQRVLIVGVTNLHVTLVAMTAIRHLSVNQSSCDKMTSFDDYLSKGLEDPIRLLECLFSVQSL